MSDLQRVRVELGERSYSIFLGYDIWKACIAQLKEISPEKEVFLVSDRHVFDLFGCSLEELLAREGYRCLWHVVSPGEGSKNWTEAGVILEKMLENNLGRKAPLLALGGGVIGDLAGFTAAVYRRGVPFVQIPTSLLAQVDSSVGGKVAVNHPLGKNMLGTFYQPQAVWADLSVLNSLPVEEWRAGLAEVVKYGIIRDEQFFCFLEEHARAVYQKDPRVIPEVVKRCCMIKAEVVGLDERDEGLRNILNFGHTIGHALESASAYSSYKHGEAVAIGINGAFHIARRFGWVGEALQKRVENLLLQWELPVSFPARYFDEVLKNIYYDKKVVGKKLVFVLPRGLGQVTIEKGLTPEQVKQAIGEITTCP